MFSRNNAIDNLFAKSAEFDSIMDELKVLEPDYEGFFERAKRWNKRFKGIMVNIRNMRIESGMGYFRPCNEEAEKVFTTHSIHLGEKTDIGSLDNVFIDKCIIEVVQDKYSKLLDESTQLKSNHQFNEPLKWFKDIFEVFFYSKYFEYARQALDIEYTLEGWLLNPSLYHKSDRRLNSFAKPFLQEMNEVDRIAFTRPFDYIKFYDFEYDLEDTNWFNQFEVKVWCYIPEQDRFIGRFARGIIDKSWTKEGEIVKELLVHFSKI